MSSGSVFSANKKIIFLFDFTQYFLHILFIMIHIVFKEKLLNGLYSFFDARTKENLLFKKVDNQLQPHNYPALVANERYGAEEFEEKIN